MAGAGPAVVHDAHGSRSTRRSIGQHVGFRRAATLLAYLVASQSLAATPSVAPPNTPQRDVAIERYPRRIVSLLPSLTEIVCALGACDRLVATDRYSNWPSQVRSLPKAGGLDDADVGTIVELDPDLVLLSPSQHITARLNELHVRSFAITTESYSDIGRSVTVIGEILGLIDQAAALNRLIEQRVREIADRARRGREARPPAVYFEVDSGPYAAGPESFIGELLTRLGVRNIVTADLGHYPKLNPEYVVQHDPDIIFIAPYSAAHLDERPGWQGIRAVREHRVCSFSSDVRDALVRPGPRVVAAIGAMADCLGRVAP